MDQLSQPLVLIRFRRRDLVVQCLTLAVAAAGAGMIATGDGELPAFRAMLIAASTALAVAALATAQRVLRGRIALTLGPDGFAVHRYVVGVIPWTAIAHVTPLIGRRSSQMVLTLRPADAARLVPRWRRALALKLRLIRHDRLTLDVARLDERPLEIVRMFERRVHTSRGMLEDAPLADLGLPHPPANAETRPAFAYGLMALLLVVYAAEVALALRPTAHGTQIDPLTLIALGGSVRMLVFDHAQVWRLVTASLLHGGLLHIGLNLVALVYAARRLESRIGWRWFAATFAVSAIGGSLTSVLVNPPNLVGVGASGGIVGLSAATAIVAFRFPVGAMRARMLGGALRILVPSLLPIAAAVNVGGGTVDVAAHGGGAIGGALAGLAIRALWPDSRQEPRGGRAALAIAAGFFLTAAASIVPIVGAYRNAGQLAPDLPTSVPEATARSARLLPAYPRDPRVRYMHALGALNRNDLAGAAADLRAALRDPDMLHATVPDFDPFVRGLLALVIVDKDRPGAEALLAGHCSAVNAVYKDALPKQGLCR